MSALRSIDVTQAPGTGGTVEVPMSYTPSLDKVLLDGNPRLLDFPASAGTFTPSMLSQIIVPSAGSRYILGGSTYLNFDLALSATVTSGGTPQVLAYFTGGPTKSAAALIDRITISAGGTTLADIGNYAVWHNMVLLHAASQDYSQSAQILENSFNTIAYAAVGAISGSVTVSLPLAVGLLNSTKAFPLWAFNAPLVINIYWNSLVKSVGVAPSQNSAIFNAVSSLTGFSGSWTGSNLSLRCACVDVDPEYIIQQKKQMAAGKLLVYQYDQIGAMQTNAGAASINFGVNCSSLLGVFGAQITTNAASYLGSNSAEGSASSTLCSGSWGFSANNADSIRVFRDGTQLSSFPLCAGKRDDAYPALQQALGVLFSTSNATLCKRGTKDYIGMSGANFKLDPSTVVASKFNLPPIWGIGSAIDSGSVFQPCGFVWGLSARKCSDDNVSNQGVYCQQLQVSVDSGDSSAGTHYIFYAYSSALAIDVVGNCVVKR